LAITSAHVRKWHLDAMALLEPVDQFGQ